MKSYSKGSEWRKWDLHVHTPFSVLYHNFDGNTFDEKWEKYITTLETVEGVAVLGITDYFSIEGYKKILLEKKAGRLKNFDLILANVELRLDISTRNNQPVNIHVIFSPQVINKLDTRFFSRLSFSYRKHNYSATKNDLINLGRAVLNNSICSEEEALKKGIEQFKVSKDNLFKLFNEDQLLCEHSFIVIADHSKDGASGVRKSSLQALREELYRFSNAIFSSNENTCKYFLGEGTDSCDLIKSKYGTLKPCIHGSDAHNLHKICKPDKDRFTWIKADPTFEGLRQIIFEPKARVYIGKENPQTTCVRPYFSSIHIGAGQVFSTGQLQFKHCDIELNPNLVCIIGGRGTGKSVLLSAIRKTFCKTSSNNPDDKSTEIHTEHFNVAFTKIDASTEKYTIQNDNNLDYLHVSQGEVKYIVQNPDVLDQQIKSMLGIVEPGKTLFEDGSMKSILNQIIDLKIFFNETNEQEKLINVVSFQKHEILKNKQLISTITTEKNKGLIELYCKNLDEIANMDNFLGNISDLDASLLEAIRGLNIKIENLNKNFQDSSKIEEINVTKQLDQIKILRSEFNKKAHELQKKNSSIAAEFKTAGIEGDIPTLLEKVSQYQIKIKGHEKEIENINSNKNEFLDAINKLKLHSSVIQEKLNCHIETLTASWQMLRNGKDGWTKDQIDLCAKLTDGIEVKGKVQFDIDKFYHAVDLSINKSKFRATKEESVDQRIKKFFSVKSTEDYFKLLENKKIFDVGDVRLSLSDVLDGDYLVKDGDRDLLNALFDSGHIFSYLKVICELTYKDKTPDQLSAGQRGTLFVCLKLATDTFGQPFIFDQPEDDLDNHFIMHELVPLFRVIKQFRQVIVVTH